MENLKFTQLQTLSVGVTAKVAKTHRVFGIKIKHQLRGVENISTPPFNFSTMIFEYFKHTILPFDDGEYLWHISPNTGSLIRQKSTNKIRIKEIPDKVTNALTYCDNPFLCKFYDDENANTYNSFSLTKVNAFHNKLLKISNNRFLLTKLYSSCKRKIFETTSHSINAINSLELHNKKRHELCLQRSFLAAKTSKSFTKDGVIFIGAFLPTGDMHCWIIENSNQPDINDRGWINYRPLIAFYNQI